MHENVEKTDRYVPVWDGELYLEYHRGTYLSNVSTEVAGFRNVLDEFGKSLYTGSVDPEEYLPQLEKKLEATGIDKVIDEMQKQIDEWKAEK